MRLLIKRICASRSHIAVIEEVGHPELAMPRNARIPKIDLSDPRLHELARRMNELADERAGSGATFAERSAETQAIAEEVLRRVARRRGAGDGNSTD